jgi:hypothetical protein
MREKTLLLSLLTASFLSFLCGVHGSPHILPIAVQVEGDTSENHIDVSGLGDGKEFYSYDELEIQVLSSAPMWTFQNAKMSDEMFVGHNEDKTLWCSLFRFFSDDGLNIVTTGTVKDIVNGTWYVMKRNAAGQHIVVVQFDKDFPDEGDVKSENPSDNSMEVIGDSNDPTLPEQSSSCTIRLLVLWTRNAECLYSGLSNGCSVTETTKANIQAQASALIAEANTVHSNTRTGVRFEGLVGRETTFTENGSMDDSLDSLADPSDGSMDYIHSWR